MLVAFGLGCGGELWLVHGLCVCVCVLLFGVFCCLVCFGFLCLCNFGCFLDKLECLVFPLMDLHVSYKSLAILTVF